MNKKSFISIIAGMSMMGMAVMPVFAASPSMSKVPVYKENYSRSQIAFHDAMRKLWEDHVTWTRLVIIDIVDGLASANNDTARLLKNYDDMEDAIKPFYGVAASETFGDLMKVHLTTAAELVSAAKAGDSAKASDAEKRWYANADDLAKFLSKANPKAWPEKTVKAMLYEHLKITKNEAVARIGKNYPADSAAYDMIHAQALMMADALSDGIMSQFSNEFRGNSMDWQTYREPTVGESTAKKLGKFLVAGNDMTLYATTNDKPNKSNCYDTCAAHWTPLTVTGQIVASTNLLHGLSTIKRTDGAMQVAYKGWPLYLWVGDKKVGDTTGNGVNGVWHVVKP